MKGILTDRHPLVAATLLVAVGVLAGCSESNGSTPATTASAPISGGPPATTASAPVSGGPSAAAGGSTVEIANFAFNPSTLTVPAGSTVTWKFDDTTEHTVVADDNSFMSDAMGSGQTYEHAFPAAGTLSYHCSIHPFMKGSIVVK